MRTFERMGLSVSEADMVGRFGQGVIPTQPVCTERLRSLLDGPCDLGFEDLGHHHIDGDTQKSGQLFSSTRQSKKVDLPRRCDD